MVAYDGVPKTIEDDELGASGVFHTGKGMVIAGQPHGAATWWYPVNDHPSDKATYSFRVAAPKELQVITNGVLLAPYQTYTPPPSDDEPGSCSSTGTTGAWNAATGTSDGYEPWRIDLSAYAGKQVELSISYASDSAGGPVPGRRTRSARPAASSRTRTGCSSRWRSRPPGLLAAVLHRRAEHQRGRARERASVVRRQPGPRPMEGHLAERRFASYAEWLWSEHEGGLTAQQFANAVYDRGAMILHALRVKVGDTGFFRILNTWAAQNKGRNVATEGFIALAQRISGEDLTLGAGRRPWPSSTCASTRASEIASTSRLSAAADPGRRAHATPRATGANLTGGSGGS